MNEFEKTMGKALADNVNEQYGEYFDVEKKHKFSWAYRKARRKNILSAEKTRGGRPIPAAPRIPAPAYATVIKGVPLKKRVAVLSIAIMMAVGLGTGVGASLAVGFKKADVTKEDFRLEPVNMESAKEFIEYEYYIPDIPDEFYLEKYDSNKFDITFSYVSHDEKKLLFFKQCTKNGSLYHDNELWDGMEDIMVGDKYGTLIVTGDVIDLIWDNGDYILSVSGMLSVDEAMRLAESVQRRDTFSEGFEYFNP